MHAPDGFYNNSLCIIMDLACTGVLAYSLKKTWKRITRKEMLLASCVGAFGFALEMANFSVTRGSSCHFMGGVLASIVLGPYLATGVMTMVHLVQVLLFQDGGIMALGPNLLTIVCISTFGGYYIYSLLKNLVIEPYGHYISAFLSAWLSLLVTSLIVCAMLAVCGIEGFAATLGHMVGPHVLVGIAEGMLTVLVLAGINVIAPDLLGHQQASAKSVKTLAFCFLGAAFLISLAISPFASRSAGGLEKFVLDHRHLGPHRIVVPFRAPIPDYHLPGIRDHEIAKILGGTLGTMVTFFVCLLGCALMLEKVSAKEKIEPEKA
ncbi:MAG: energy-coupling factor ABC transporter permease [bacterium]